MNRTDILFLKKSILGKKIRVNLKPQYYKTLKKQIIFNNIAEFLDQETVFELAYCCRIFKKYIKSDINLENKFLKQTVQKLKSITKFQEDKEKADKKLKEMFFCLKQPNIPKKYKTTKLQPKDYQEEILKIVYSSKEYESNLEKMNFEFNQKDLEDWKYDLLFNNKLDPRLKIYYSTNQHLKQSNSTNTVNKIENNKQEKKVDENINYIVATEEEKRITKEEFIRKNFPNININDLTINRCPFPNMLTNSSQSFKEKIKSKLYSKFNFLINS